MDYKLQTIIFTDGASRGNPGPGGWGAVVIQNEKVNELGGREDHTTNNRMELTAALKALEFLSSYTPDPKPYTLIYTDSSYLINGITKWIFSWERRNWITKNKEPVLNKDLWERILELSRGKKIEWKYVGGHSGIAGNERVDQIATSFADLPKTTFGHPKSVFGNGVELFSGPISDYKIDILNLNGHDYAKASLGEGKKKKDKTRSKATAYSYLSMVNGVIKTHKTWAECEKRVKGKSGAKYKKALTPTEEKEIIKSWK